MHTPARRIAHLDMDAFFAAVGLLRYSELRGRPVIMGGGSGQQPFVLADGSRRFARLRDYAGRGVVTTATYEARALGVHSGMAIMTAARLAPDAVLLPVDFAACRHYSNAFKTAVARIAPQIEDRGIDEIYIDLSAFPDATRPLALRIKEAAAAATGLSCSIGVAGNKLLAKICSDLDKPDGLTVLAAGEIAERIWPLAVGKINGVGPRASARLAALGVHTIGDLVRADAACLQQQFGRSHAAWLLDAAHGVDERPLITSTEPRSISRETTFERDLHARDDRDQLTEILTSLCARVAEDLQRKNCLGRTVGLKVRFADFETLTRDLTLAVPMSNLQTIRRAAGECLRRVPLDRKLRLLGVRVGSLSAARIFDAQSAPRQGELPLDGHLADPVP